MPRNITSPADHPLNEPELTLPTSAATLRLKLVEIRDRRMVRVYVSRSCAVGTSTPEMESSEPDFPFHPIAPPASFVPLTRVCLMLCVRCLLPPPQSKLTVLESSSSSESSLPSSESSS